MQVACKIISLMLIISVTIIIYQSNFLEFSEQLCEVAMRNPGYITLFEPLLRLHELHVPIDR